MDFAAAFSRSNLVVSSAWARSAVEARASAASARVRMVAVWARSSSRVCAGVTRLRRSKQAGSSEME